MDFPSSTEIEKHGGVHVIIATIPNYHLQLRQFIGRTARIGNKGTYSLYCVDKNSRNNSTEVYFRKRLEQLKNNDLLDLANFVASNAQVDEAPKDILEE